MLRLNVLKTVNGDEGSIPFTRSILSFDTFRVERRSYCVRPGNAAEGKKYFERVRSIREAPAGASARIRRLSLVQRRLLLLLLLPALVGRIDWRRGSHGKKQIANRRFGRWMLLDLSHL